MSIPASIESIFDGFDDQKLTTFTIPGEVETSHLIWTVAFKVASWEVGLDIEGGPSTIKRVKASLEPI